VRVGERVNITGKCDGKPISANQNDNDRENHQHPDHRETKEAH